ncbi:hypothetical protein GCM10010978_32460 [Compostibacillus humi]|uniref:SH3 domain-containing protein n=1 Tax=Compostibacillus humi TaxID=1245525 RepID=A0A8J2TTW8_9BACI|nr:hypothetical protein [Compostibacillus humi]GFZ91319.1 hypothetical protein GCM10010978_32460 [Compostibacillus humi]
MNLTSTLKSIFKKVKNKNYFFNSFVTIESNVPVYDNRSGKLVKVGLLEKGLTYYRISDYGNWHKVQFSNFHGFVKKEQTKMSFILKNKVNNVNVRVEEKYHFLTKKETNVYLDQHFYKVIGKILPNQKYNLLEINDNYCKIVFLNNIAYLGLTE